MRGGGIPGDIEVTGYELKERLEADVPKPLLQGFFNLIFQFTSSCRFHGDGCHLNNCFLLFLETDHPLSSLVSSGSVGPNEKPLALMKRTYKPI